MRVQNIDENWRFENGTPNPYSDFLGQGQGITVNLPHDYMIGTEVREDAPAGAASGYYTALTAHYKKKLEIPKEWEQDRIFLRFDGVMMNATVEVNGGKAALHHCGYTPFCLDITSYVFCGETNQVTVTVNPSMQPNARWYTGAGIIRSVELLHTPKIHIVNDGIYGYTKRISCNEKGEAVAAFLNTEVEVRNTTGEDHMAIVEVSLVKEETGETVVKRQSKIQIDAGTTETAYLALTVQQPKLWRADDPQLYRLAAKVTDIGVFKTHFVESEEKTADEDSVLFGIRSISADVQNGLLINGEQVKLKGGCVHHDNGVIGAVSLYDAEVRRISKMKEIGFNAIRTTHNPPSKILLEVCDRLGMYVFAEAFDAWGMGKQPGDYNQYFDADWEEDLTAFVKRDRNHPAVIIWSTGNEIVERGGLNHGYTLATRLAEKVKLLDRSRPVSNGICTYWNGLDDCLMAENLRKMVQHMKEGVDSLQNVDGGKEDDSWEEMSEAFTNGLDIVGYNYMEDKYPRDHEMYPERVILGSENYPKEIGKRWPMVEKQPYIIGDFTWTAWDYIGEAGIGKALFVEPDDPRMKRGANGVASEPSQFPSRLANCGDIDIGGMILPQGNYRSVVFGSDQTYLFSYDPANYGKKEILSNWGFPSCQRSWNWKGAEGKMTQLLVFSRAEEVELSVNGKIVGRKKQGEALCIDDMPLTFVFETEYEPGEVTAVSYTDGQEVSRDRLVTAGEAYALKITADKTQIIADRYSLAYALVEIVDREGRRVPDAAHHLKASVVGEAILAGFGSGNPITAESYAAGEFTTYRGCAYAVIRSTDRPGKALLRIEGEAGMSQETEIDIAAVRE
ncbi:MAG: DUF4982 domain-containing protein [Roseburia sp.]|nr:DUF4982 domain-containing protein [Roseburia sp.]MCM1098485.1 DUF4982 domain-containing protein [Ruminococcus flavefaciens]